MNLNRRQSLVGLFSSALVGLSGGAALAYSSFAEEAKHEIFVRVARVEIQRRGFIAGHISSASDVVSVGNVQTSWFIYAHEPGFEDMTASIVQCSGRELAVNDTKCVENMARMRAAKAVDWLERHGFRALASGNNQTGECIK